mgnify:FL=1
MRSVSDVLGAIKAPPKECGAAYQAWLDTQAMTDEEKRVFLDKKNEEATQAALKQIMIPKTWGKSLWSGGKEIKFSFSNWNYSKQENQELAKQVAIQAKTLSDQLKDNNFNVVFLGGAGVGKTSLAIAMITALRRADKSAMVISTTELVSKLNRSYDFKDAQREIAKVEQGAYDCDVLLLDDLGTESGGRVKEIRTDMYDLMYRIANARLDKTTIITTNNTPAELGKIYSEKIVSRLLPKQKERCIDMHGLKDVRGL